MTMYDFWFRRAAEVLKVFNKFLRDDVLQIAYPKVAQMLRHGFALFSFNKNKTTIIWFMDR